MDPPFTWRVTKDRRVLISRQGHLVAELEGTRGQRLAVQLQLLAAAPAQQLLARVTGNSQRSGAQERGQP